jgi:uncharacterized protein YeaO (DUF488 family)
MCPAIREIPVPVALKRAYEKRTPADGTRVLVERLWPRGVSKARAGIDVWLKDLAPSAALRKWFHARPSLWLQFRKRYLAELSDPAAAAALEQLHELVDSSRTVTLVFAAKDAEHNNAVVLKELLEGMRKPPSSSGPEGAAALPARSRMRSRR